jgi:uncharacterized glyoxalase superfamily protein PhnB
MLVNRSAPQGAVIPVIFYDNPGAAADWLCRVFGFTERLRAGNDHIQLVLDFGAGVGGIMLSRSRSGLAQGRGGQYTHVPVADVDALYARVSQFEDVVRPAPPASHPYGERQFGMDDPFGQHWVFSQPMADVDPAEWGAVVKLAPAPPR